MIKSCKNCSERHFKCHSACEKYLSEKAELEKLSALIREVEAEENFFYYSDKKRTEWKQ